MPAPYQLLGVYTKAPNPMSFDTFITHRHLDSQMFVNGNADASLNNHWTDAKFADVEKFMTDAWDANKEDEWNTTATNKEDGGEQQKKKPRPYFFKSTFHRNQIQHGNATLVLEHGRDVTTELTALHPIPATVIVVPHLTAAFALDEMFMMAHMTVEEMRKINADQWWAAAIYMLDKDESIDSFPFAGAQGTTNPE
ncbi:hypothetical protein PG988_004427 [Apiospora saccharicola]